MDTLPIELLRLIFEYCDASTSRKLRLVSPVLAEIGYDYMMPSHFTSVAWRDDVKRLHSIATHERLRTSINSLTFNFSEVEEYNARHASYYQHWLQDPEERRLLLEDAWSRFYKLEGQRKELVPFDGRSAMIEEVFRHLTNLKSLEVTYTRCPYDIDVLAEVFQEVQSCRKIDRVQACKNMDTIVSALTHSRLSSLTIDRLPLEIFKTSESRRHWFNCGRAFESLERLDLTLDASNILYPSSKLRAVNGLGRVLQFSPHLTHLSLAFQSHQAPQQKFMLRFHILLEGFTFQKLTDLRLEGINCEEHDLLRFLIRHSSTLERVRLGGRGLAKPYELSSGGLHLCHGTFRSLFASLRGRLPKLKRFHMEGDFEAGDALGAVGERYNFRAVSDENWQPVPTAGRRPASKKTLDCLELERYLVHGGDFPDLAVPEDQ